MSQHDKTISTHILLLDGITFASCIMSAISLSDTDNTRLLAIAFPDIVIEAYKRRHGPAGCVSVNEWLMKFDDMETPGDYIKERFIELDIDARRWMTEVIGYG